MARSLRGRSPPLQGLQSRGERIRGKLARRLLEVPEAPRSLQKQISQDEESPALPNQPRPKSGTWRLSLMPGVMAGSFGLMRLLGTSVPDPQPPGLDALAALLVFFIAALGEQLGWTGYILESLQQRWSQVRAGVTWGRHGPFGTSCRCCKQTGRRPGSHGNVSRPCRFGLRWSGCTSAHDGPESDAYGRDSRENLPRGQGAGDVA
jgi:hypothetical protein